MNRAALLTLLAAAPVLMAGSIDGQWQGTVTVDGSEVPFRFELSGDGSSVKGTFFNGEERFTSTSGNYSNHSLELKWEYFAAKLTAKVDGDAIEGTYDRARGKPMAFHARRGPAKTALDKGPVIDGLWIIEDVASKKGESAWHFIVKQRPTEVSAAILRVDGDTGTLSGSYDGEAGKFVLSHFSGLRPARLEITVNKDGSLKLVEGNQTMTAIRVAEVRARQLAVPTDPTRHTGVKNPSEPFHFSFADLQGRTVSDTDPRFKNKVVLVNITGSWCPNCHDEAPFLAGLDKKYKDQGLEIVALSFEEADQLKDPVRLRAFINKYRIEYTVLLGGEPNEANTKLTEAVNWNSWPTTFFVGRDGHVHFVHAGFPSNGSGELYRQAKEEFTAQVESLLAK